MKNITPAADENRIRQNAIDIFFFETLSLLHSLSLLHFVTERKKKKLENTVMESYVDLPAQRRIGESPQNSES